MRYIKKIIKHKLEFMYYKNKLRCALKWCQHEKNIYDVWQYLIKYS